MENLMYPNIVFSYYKIVIKNINTIEEWTIKTQDIKDMKGWYTLPTKTKVFLCVNLSDKYQEWKY